MSWLDSFRHLDCFTSLNNIIKHFFVWVGTYKENYLNWKLLNIKKPYVEILFYTVLTYKIISFKYFLEFLNNQNILKLKNNDLLCVKNP